MEEAPLTLAQATARKALQAGSTPAAVEEHGRAAALFAKTAESTDNAEAQRTLRLLENHHCNLAKLIGVQLARADRDKRQQQQDPVETDKKHSNEQPEAVAVPPPVPSPDKSPYRPDSRSLAPVRRPPRDAGSTITSKLASARGIPAARQTSRSSNGSSALVSQHNAEGKIVTPSRSLKSPTSPLGHDGRDQARRASKTKSKSLKTAGATSKTTSTTDPLPIPPSFPASLQIDSFNRFYSAFENVFSRLSAPLAFAGLPLRPNEQDQSVPSAHQPTGRSFRSRPRNSTRATASPEYSHLFSPAALAAIPTDFDAPLSSSSNNAGQGTFAFGAAGESFYVVPTTGGTLPYASILARRQTQPSGHTTHNAADGTSQTRAAALDDVDEAGEDFVDAKESLQPSTKAPAATTTTTTTTTTTAAAATAKAPSGKTLEELDLENTALRSLLDEVSRRLWQFEVSSQMMGGAVMRASVMGEHAERSDAVKRGEATIRSEAIEPGGDLAERERESATSGREEARKGVVRGGQGRGEGEGEGEGRRARASAGAGDVQVTVLQRENEKLKATLGKYRDRWDKLKEGARVKERERERERANNNNTIKLTPGKTATGGEIA